MRTRLLFLLSPTRAPRGLVGLGLVASVAAATFTLPAIAASPRPAGEAPVLNVYNWSDYIAEDTIRKFEAETGITVRYDNFDSNEILHAKLVAGKSGYDVVVPSSYWAKLQADGGLLQPLDKSKLPNLRHLDPAVQAQLAQLDPGNRYAVDWLWGYTTVGINVDKVRTALGDLPMPANAWDLLFKPEYISRLHACGVSLLDSATEVLPAAMHYLGKQPFPTDPAELQAALPLLKSIRPYVSLFSSSGYINDLANGSLCAVLGWSGDINIARRRAIEGKTGQRIEALIPKTGAVLFFDVMVIPADAPHPNNAHRFIDYIMRPEVHASLTNTVYYANPNKASRRFIAPEVADNPTVFLSDEAMQHMRVPGAITSALRRSMTRLYTAFKTARWPK